MNNALTAKEAAAAIHGLINSRVSSPRREELEAIIAKVATPATGIMGDAVHRAEWEAVASATKAAYARAIDLEDAGGASEAIEAADAAADEADRRLDECAQRIIDTPVRSFADIALLASVFFRMLWTGKNLTDPDADGELESGPPSQVEGIGLDALRALLRGIRDLSALPPAPTGLGDPPLLPSGRLAQLQAAVAAVESVEDSLGGRLYSESDDAALRVVDRRFDALTKEVWASPVRTPADLKELAVIARHWCRDFQRHDGVESPWQYPAEIDDHGEEAIGRLIHAVLQYGAPPADLWQDPALQEASAAIRAWHGAFTEEGVSVAADASRDAQIAAADANVKAAAQRIWDTPPTSLADVVARALIFETWSDQVEDGVLVYLDPAELTKMGHPRHCDLSALAHLLDAIRKVSGANNGPLLDHATNSQPAISSGV